ncbi:MAG: CHASE3 domain-containing protein, partial [Steroidobacteraceae bacterium]
MKWNVGTKIAVGFGVAVVIFVLVNIVSYRSTTELVGASESRKHTYDVLIELSQVAALLKDAEIGQRSYVLTGDDAFLAPYVAASDRINGTLDRLRELTADNPRQQRRLERLEPLVKNRLAYAAEAIEVRRARGLEAGSQFVAQGAGKAFSDQINALIAEIESEENNLLEQRAAVSDANARNARATIIFGTLAALLLAALAGFSITRNIAGPLRHLTGIAERI